MKNLLTLSILIVTLSLNGLSQGLLKSVSNMQSETSEKVKQMLMQSDSERDSGAKTSSKNYAAFKPSPSENLKNIANELGKTDEEKAAFLQVFTETKKGFEAEAARIGAKNNVAGAMAFLMAISVMVYHQSPEPSDAATKKLFEGLNSMFGEMPQMATAPNNEKQFLYDLYISYGGLIFASYQEALGTKNKETIDAIRVIAGSTLLDFFKINPTTIYFEGDSLRMKSEASGGEPKLTQSAQPISRSHAFAKQTTNFDDGWASTPTEDYVSVRKNGVEVRLIYDNKQIDDARPTNMPYADYYWSKTVTPYFNVSNVENWSCGACYEMEYSVQADAVDRQTGKRSFVYLFFSGQGGNRGVSVVVTPNRSEFQKEFPNPRIINAKMRYYNKFGVSTQDLVGTWTTPTGGGGYNFYSAAGSWVGMSALSHGSDFSFDSSGNYRHVYTSANLNMGSSQFARIDYKGKFSVTDWEVTATNHYNGATAKFAAQIIAVRGGYLLVLTDKRSDIKYAIFKK
jgi:hypothetical protein